jgi:predicted  nucleic acid-binding Zn-ribbon protein
MTGNEDPSISREKLTRETQQAKASSGDLMARVVEVAEALARTEESVAATMESLASQRPERAERLMALSDAARKQAAYARQWVKDHSPVAEGR